MIRIVPVNYAMAHAAGLTLRIALLIERFSRNVQPNAPKLPPERLQFSHAVRGLNIDEALYAIHQPPAHYEFIREDAYFKRVEGLLGSLE
jgi:hypothetical protein